VNLAAALKTPRSTLANRIRSKQGISRSNLITSLVVGGFVTLVVLGLVFAYVLIPSGHSASTTQKSLFFSGITLISGSASSSSLNKSCSGDSYLEVYVTNNSNNTIYMENVTMLASNPSNSGTSLVSLSNGCIVISEDPQAVEPGSIDQSILTYPNVPVPFLSNWNVTVYFSNGQNLTQTRLTAEAS
jgi:hypothetical protein